MAAPETGPGHIKAIKVLGSDGNMILTKKKKLTEMNSLVVFFFYFLLLLILLSFISVFLYQLNMSTNDGIIYAILYKIWSRTFDIG